MQRRIHDNKQALHLIVHKSKTHVAKVVIQAATCWLRSSITLMSAPNGSTHNNKQTNKVKRWGLASWLTESDPLSETYLACCSHHHACAHGFSNTGHDTSGWNISSVCRVTVATYRIHNVCVCVCVSVRVCVRWGKGRKRCKWGTVFQAAGGLVSDVQEVLTCEHTRTHQDTRTHTQWDVCTARGVCILRGDYMDENRGVFSTDLESDWCDKETIEGGWSQSKQRAHTRTQVRWIRNLMLCGPARTRAHGRTQLLSTLWCFKSRELLCDAVEVMKVEKRTDHLGCICVSSIIN